MRRTYTVDLTSRAAKDLADLPAADQARIRRALQRLVTDPYRAPGVAKLAGPTDRYRIRVGDYRVIYVVQDAELRVLVIRVAHRKEAYR